MSEIDVCPQHSGVVTSLDNIIKGQSEMKDSLANLVELVQEKLAVLVQRPSWLVCIAISIQSSAIGVMATFILYHHFGK